MREVRHRGVWSAQLLSQRKADSYRQFPLRCIFASGEAPWWSVRIDRLGRVDAGMVFHFGLGRGDPRFELFPKRESAQDVS